MNLERLRELIEKRTPKRLSDEASFDDVKLRLVLDTLAPLFAELWEAAEELRQRGDGATDASNRVREVLTALRKS